MSGESAHAEHTLWLMQTNILSRTGGWLFFRQQRKRNEEEVEEKEKNDFSPKNI